MEPGDEEATQESSRSCSRQARRIGAQRGKAEGQPRKWRQGWPSQKPQENCCRPAQCTSFAPWPQGVIEIVIASIRARFGDEAIGLGNSGIRFTPTAGAGVPHARMAIIPSSGSSRAAGWRASPGWTKSE
jgi:hypothetical protein